MAERDDDRSTQPVSATSGVIGLIAWFVCGLISIAGLAIGMSQTLVAFGIDLAILAAGAAIALSPRLPRTESAAGAAALAVSGGTIAVTQAVGGVSFLDGQLIIIALLCLCALRPRLSVGGAIGLFGGLGVLGVLAVGASVGVAMDAARLSSGYQAEAFIQQFAAGTRLLFLDRLLTESVALVVLAVASVSSGTKVIGGLSRVLAIVAGMAPISARIISIFQAFGMQ